MPIKSLDSINLLPVLSARSAGPVCSPLSHPPPLEGVMVANYVAIHPTVSRYVWQQVIISSPLPVTHSTSLRPLDFISTKFRP